MLAIFFLFGTIAALAAPGRSRPDETRLFERIGRGEAEALRALYDRCAGRAMAVAVRVLKNEGEAEEVVQETFLEVWKRARDYDGARGGALAWITAIARSRAIDRLRSRGSAERTAEAAAREPAAEAPTPIEAVEERARREQVAAALAALPAEQREVLELCYFAGLSQREVAEKTGTPLGTVKTRVRLAMDKLASLLGGGS